MDEDTKYYSGALSLNEDKKSPFWMCSFIGPDGKQKRRSTKVPVKGGVVEGVHVSAKAAKRLAMQKAMAIASAERAVFERENNVTVREWFNTYITQHSHLVAEKTVNNAKTAYKFFFRALGKKADSPLRLVSKADVLSYVASRRAEVRFETVKKDLAAISQAFRFAVDSEVILKNPCERVSIPPDRAGEKIYKEAFSVDDIRYILEKFPPEWASAVRCCFESFGQRLSDILNLGWEQFDWKDRCVLFRTQKTGRIMVQPMREEFFNWAFSRWQCLGKPKAGFLHPRLRLLGDGASYQFGLLLRSHGIGVLSPEAGGKRKRRLSKTFHSLRATCATLLHVGGVSEAMAMELVGHESSTVHKVYVRPSNEQLRAVAEVLPSLEN